MDIYENPLLKIDPLIASHTAGNTMSILRERNEHVRRKALFNEFEIRNSKYLTEIKQNVAVYYRSVHK